MMSIGPFSIKALMAAAAVLLAWLVPRFCWRGAKGRRGNAAGAAVLDAVAVGLLAARLGYVFRWWPDYAAAPWSILSIGDGGFYWWAGLPAATLFGWWRTRGRPALRWPMYGGMAIGLAGWVLAQGMLAAILNTAPPLPALTLETLDGHPVSLQKFIGRPVVLNLWATWCPPCQREMPVLERAQHRYPGVDFVMANQGEDTPVIRRFLGAHGLRFRHLLLDPSSSTLKSTRSRGLPTTLFFSPDGRLIESHMGEITAARLNDILQNQFQSHPQAAVRQE